MPKLKSTQYHRALKTLKSETFAIRRLKTLLLRIITRREKITDFLVQDWIDPKEEKARFSLLSSILDAEKKIKTELKELMSEKEKTSNTLGQILA